MTILGKINDRNSHNNECIKTLMLETGSGEEKRKRTDNFARDKATSQNCYQSTLR